MKHTTRLRAVLQAMDDKTSSFGFVICKYCKEPILERLLRAHCSIMHPSEYCQVRLLLKDIEEKERLAREAL